ncbi:MAG: GNAT family N-acetyltransferase [Candidatus Thorarchaeota archaeon]
MKPYLIREPKNNEIYEALIVLYKSFGRIIPPDINNQEKLLIDLIESKIAKLLIAEIDKKIIGLGAVFIFQDVCSIGYMAVLPEIRCNGVGTAIFNKLLNIAKMLGCKTFLLYASKLGEPIYQKFGFRSNYRTSVYELPNILTEAKFLSENVKIVKQFPEWAANIDSVAMGFDRCEFINIQLSHGSKLVIVDKVGYALISGQRLGPLIARNLHTAVDLIRMSISLGANHMIVPKHSKIPDSLFNLIKLTKREDETNLKMIYGKRILQKLDYFYALGTYAKG